MTPGFAGSVQRSGLAPRSESSRYGQMAIDYFEKISTTYNIVAGVCNWLLLAGFVIGPSAQLIAQQVAQQVSWGQRLVNTPLLVVSLAFTGAGAVGLISLWILCRANYLWLLHKIFLPGFLNGVAGALSATLNIWAVRGGHFNFNEYDIITISVTGGATVVFFASMIIYYMGCIPSKPPPEPSSASTKVAPALQPETPKHTHHIPEVTVHEATPQHSRTSIDQLDQTTPAEKNQKKKDGGPEAGAVGNGAGIGAAPAAAAVATAGGDAGGAGGGGGGGGDGGGGGGD